MLQDHTTAQAMTTRYTAVRPRRRRDKMVRPPQRRNRPVRRIIPRPAASS